MVSPGCEGKHPLGAAGLHTLDFAEELSPSSGDQTDAVTAAVNFCFLPLALLMGSNDFLFAIRFKIAQTLPIKIES